MSLIKTKESATLNARPQDVYATIADYKNGHPRIVPPETFSDMRVEQGGYGEGTVIRFKTKILGAVQEFYQRVTEPEPGRVLVEQDIDSAQHVVTTFTVTPVENGQKSHVEISTTMNASPGIRGVVERLVVTKLNPRVYRKELKRLEEVAQHVEA